MPEEEKAHLSETIRLQTQVQLCYRYPYPTKQKEGAAYPSNIYPGTFPDLLQGMYAVVIDQCDPFLFPLFSSS